MPGSRGRKLSDRTVGGLRVEGGDAIFWDRDLPGFGVRVYPSGAKAYVVQARSGGRSKRVTVGRHGALPATEARRRAARLIARIKRWEEPPLPCSDVPAAPGGGAPAAPAAPTVSDLAERYLAEHVAAHCKPRTLALYREVVHRRLLPALGAVPIAELARGQVSSLHHRLRETPHAANRAIEVLGRIVPWPRTRGFDRPARTLAGASTSTGSAAASGSCPTRSTVGSEGRWTRRAPAPAERRRARWRRSACLP